MPEKKVKCQNRKGMSCIKYRGKNVYYKTGNYKDLGKKLNIHPDLAKEYVTKKGRVTKVVYNPQEKSIVKINLRDNFLPLLTRDFGIRRIANSKLLSKDTVKSKFTYIGDELPEFLKIRFEVVITMRLYWESDGSSFITGLVKNIVSSERSKPIIITTTTDKLEQKIQEYAKDYAREASATLIKVDAKIYAENGRELKWKDGRLREQQNYTLQEFTNIDYIKNNKDNCVITYLKEKYPKISVKKINEIDNNKGVAIRKLMDFLQSYNIQYNIYDGLGKIRESNKDDIQHDKSYKKAALIAYNNHIYPLKTQTPKSLKNTEHKLVIVNNCLNIVRRQLNNKIIPYNIQIDCVKTLKNQKKIKEEPGKRHDAILSNTKRNNKIIAEISILSCCVDGKKYLQNSEYIRCREILNLFEIKDALTDDIKISKLGSIIEKKYFKENIDSFFPVDNFTKGGYNYLDENYKKIKRPMVTIDKNKAYTYSLYKLPYLIVLDWRGAEITKNPTKIINNYIYIAKPKVSSILMPETNIYAGYFLKKCKKYGLEFELLEEITTTTVPNKYKRMIMDLLEVVTQDELKEIINILVGKMERRTINKIQHIFRGIYTSDECLRIKGFKLKIDEKHQAVFNSKEKVANIYNRKPIAMQVKDMCRMILFEKMLELKLKDEDIIQIKTDSITYCGKLPNLGRGIADWKEEEFTPLENVPEYIEKNLSFYVENEKNKKYIRKLYNCYAGSGKTTYIINKLIPELTKQNINFRVLTPSHEALEEYKQLTDKNGNKIACDVIQKYVYHGMPEEDYIIIDEIGFVDRNGQDLLYKMSKLDKNYESFGDFNQMPPVEKREVVDFSQSHYINLLYNENEEIEELKTNKRNNIPRKYYDKLINKELNLIEEVTKYSTENYYDAEIIICYYNFTRCKYNKLMMKHLGKKWGDIGVKYVCKTNNLLDIYDIYNHKKVIIKDKFKDPNGYYFYELSDGNIIAHDQLKKNFDLGYAVSVYNIEGKTVESFYWCQEDNIRLEQDNKFAGRLAYVLISRLKGNVYIK